VIYPNILMKPHARSKKTSYLTKRFVSNPICGGLMAWFLLRMSATERRFMIPQMMAVILKDHAREILSIMAWIPNENNNPPTPEPAEEIPIARLRFFAEPLREDGCAWDEDEA
jgi:hypothetical protein